MRPQNYKNNYIYGINIVNMAKGDLQMLIVEQKILNRIYAIRRQKVMLDEDL